MNSIKFALFRRAPKSISNALARDQKVNVNAEKAILQHDKYIELMSPLVANSVILPALEEYPDCCFVEDTAVNIKPGVLVFTRPTEPSRQGEVDSVVEAIDRYHKDLKTYRMNSKSDGGDVLVIENHLFVGNSTRSGPSAHQEWDKICRENGMIFHAINVGNDALHLKSLVTYLGQDIGLMVVNNHSGLKVMEEIKLHITNLTFIKITNILGANMVRIGNTVFYQGLFDPEIKYLTNLFHKISWQNLDMSELAKVDGALTCCSLLIK